MSVLRLSISSFFLVPITLLLSCSEIRAQQNRPVPQPPPPDTRPVAVTECQGVNNCATWTFFNKKGVGRWPTGEQAVLEITSFTNNEIVISRTDVEGTKSGLVATYRGALEDGEVAGRFMATYNGQQDVGHWYWVVTKNAGGSDQPVREPVSKTLHVTECEGENCAIGPGAVTWSFEGSSNNGIGVFGTGNQPLVLEHFDGKSIEVSRNDTVGNWLGSAIYTGQTDGTKINGTVRYFDRNHRFIRVGSWTGVIGDASVPQTHNPQNSSLTMGDVYETARTMKSVIDFWQALHGLFQSD